MSSAFTMRPGVFFNWIEVGLSPAAIATAIGGIAAHIDRGSLTPFGVGSYEQVVTHCGVSDYTRTYLHDTAKAFFRTAEAAYIVRSPGLNAKYAASVVANNYVLQSGVPVRDGTTSFTALSTGSDEDYQTLNRNVYDILWSGDVAAAGKLSITVNGTVVEATSSGDQDALAALFATNLSNCVDVATAKAVGNRCVRIIGTQNSDIEFTGIAVTGSSVTMVARDAEWLHFTVAENPGAWGSNVGLEYTKLDTGRKAVTQLLLSNRADPLNSFSGSINGHAFTVAAAAGNNELLAAVASYINTHSVRLGVTAAVTASAGTQNNRLIKLTGIDSSVDIVVTATLVKNGASANPPVINITKILDKYQPDTDFIFNVYELPNLRRVTDTYSATFAEIVSASGDVTNLATQVNNGSRRSSRVRIYMNPLVVENGWRVQGSTTLNATTREGFLEGGANGALSTSSDIIDAWSKLEDNLRYPVRILMNAGYTTNAVRSYMTQLCEKRRDCFAILDMAANDQVQDSNGQTEVDARHMLNIDSSYAAIYTPDIWILDTDRRKERWSPPSGYAGAVFALTDKTRHEWWSPAGLNRGWIPEARGLRVNYGNDAQSLFMGAQVNFIINYRNERIVIFNDRTLQYKTGPLQYIGTRRMCNTIELVATQTVAYSLFEPNTPATRNEVKRVSETLLQPMQDGGGLKRFKVVDMTKSYHIENEQAYFRYILQPINSIHQIIIDGMLTRNDSEFTETVAYSNDNGAASLAA